MRDDLFKRLLLDHAPRQDREAEWPPDLNEQAKPVLVQDPEQITALAVAAQLVDVLSRRGGTHMRPAQAEAVLAMLQSALPDFVAPHIREEVRRILEWLEHPPVWGEGEEGRAPERRRDPARAALELMDDADVALRVKLANQAIEQACDLEFEFVDIERDEWTRMRATPVEVLRGEEHDKGDDDGPRLLFEGGRELLVKRIRWLMPARRANTPKPEPKPEARIIAFPFGAPRGEE